MGAAALPLGLMAVGAGLQLGALREAPGPGRRAAVDPPRGAAAAGPGAGARGRRCRRRSRPIVVAFAALPTASSAYVLAARMGGHGAYVAGLVTLSTLLGMLSVPLALAAHARAGQADSAPLGQRPVDVLAHQRAARRRAAPASAARSPHRRVARSALPSATARLRCQRAWPMRRIALPSVRRRNSASLQAHSCSSVGAVQRVARVEVGQRRALRVLVPRADELAVVAAVDAVADQRPQLERDRPVVLDRQVGDAAPRIEPVRRRRWPASGRRRCRRCSCRNAPRPAASAAAPGRRRSRRGRTSTRRRATAPACACRASRGRCARPARPRAPAPNR